MTQSHRISCRCGTLQGMLTPTQPSNRCVCYCTDCQAFARHLGAQEALDAFGGTTIVQVPPAHLTFTQGKEQLACLRLTDKGMVRWYARCCNTPIGNTAANWKFSFVGLIHTCLTAQGQSLDASFGPNTMHVNVASATQPGAPKAAGLLSGIARIFAIVAKARLTGSYRHTPFFDPDNGAVIVTPTLLSATELAAAKRSAG